MQSPRVFKIIPGPPDWQSRLTQTTLPTAINPRMLHPPVQQPAGMFFNVTVDASKSHQAGQSVQQIGFAKEHAMVNQELVKRCECTQSALFVAHRRYLTI